MLAEALRRFLLGPGIPLHGPRLEDRLGVLQAEIHEVQDAMDSLDSRLGDLEVRVNEWLGVKGYS